MACGRPGKGKENLSGGEELGYRQHRLQVAGATGARGGSKHGRQGHEVQAMGARCDNK
jgi:hypothetical protein